MIKKIVITLFVLLASNVTTLVYSSSKNGSMDCYEAIQLNNKLQKWSIDALQSNALVECPSLSSTSTLSALERIAYKHNECSREVLDAIFSFYMKFAHNEKFGMCGLNERADLFYSKVSEDGTICMSAKVSEINDCFAKSYRLISNLRSRGELNAAFELAKKMANSNDVTGLSQMTLAMMYSFGEGTSKDLALAIKWAKIALEKIDDYDLRTKISMSLAVFYEEMQEHKNAKFYSQQCAAMGNSDCQQMFTILKKIRV